MEKLVAEAGRLRFSLVLMGSFAAVALALAAMGVYGVMAYIVRTRSHEIGVRMALDAGRSEILALVLRRALSLAAGGALSGVLIALAAARVFSRVLYGISATDPATFAAGAVFIIILAISSAYFPARRAAAIDPMSSLKYD